MKRKQLQFLLRHPRFLWYSLNNWRRGHAFGPVQRCRTCTHTTPYHYPTCGKWSLP